MPKLIGTWKVAPDRVWMWLSAIAARCRPRASTSARWSMLIVTGSSGANDPSRLPAEPSVFERRRRRSGTSRSTRRGRGTRSKDRAPRRARTPARSSARGTSGLDRVRTERVRAVSVGGEVTHPVVGRGDEPDAFLRPPIRRREIRRSGSGARPSRVSGSTSRSWGRRSGARGSLIQPHPRSGPNE